MKSRIPASLLSIILLLAASPLAPAQTDNLAQSATNTNAQDWQKLPDLKPDKKILVEFKGRGGTVKGKIVSLIGSKLTLSDDGDIYVLEQHDIQRVYRLKGRWSRHTTARIGAGIGMIVGLLIGTEKVVNSPDPENPAAVHGFALGTLAGAGLGALVGGRRRGELLYDAK